MAAGIKTGGRQKGSLNKMSGLAKENIAGVFNRIGGTEAMAQWAIENQTQFYQIYARLLPHEVTGEGGGPVQIIAAALDERL